MPPILTSSTDGESRVAAYIYAVLWLAQLIVFSPVWVFAMLSFLIVDSFEFGWELAGTLFGGG